MLMYAVGPGEADRIIMLDETEFQGSMALLSVSDALRFISDRVSHPGALNGFLSMCSVAKHPSVLGRVLTALEKMLDNGVSASASARARVSPVHACSNA